LTFLSTPVPTYQTTLHAADISYIVLTTFA
jgi:hypothetical protein